MIKVGLTGGIGSGKTTVAKMFEKLGVPVYYYDDGVKDLYDTNISLQAMMKVHFGRDIYVDGKLDRKRVASIIFNDKEKLDQLMASLQTFIEVHRDEWLILNRHCPYVVLETAILFERNLEKTVDIVIGVTASEQTRIKRTMDRDGDSRTEVLKRMALQMNNDEKTNRCDYTIVNEDLELATEKVKFLHGILMRASRTS